MTACVNKKSKRVAAVVTASLVGALSIGAPAVALAAGSGDIQLLATDQQNWSNGEFKFDKEASANGSYTVTSGDTLSFVSAKDALGNDYAASDVTVLFFASNGGDDIQPNNTLVDASDTIAKRAGAMPKAYAANGYWAVVFQGDVLDNGKLMELTDSTKLSDITAKGNDVYKAFKLTVQNKATALSGAEAFEYDGKATDKGMADVDFQYNGGDIRAAFKVDGEVVDLDDVNVVWTSVPQAQTVAAPSDDQVTVSAAGTYKAKLTAKADGKYSGSTEVSFTVKGIDLTSDAVSIAPVKTGMLNLNTKALDNSKITVNGVSLHDKASLTATLIAKNDAPTTAGSEPLTTGKYTFKLVANPNQSNVKGETTVDMYVVTDTVSYLYNGVTLNNMKFDAAKGSVFTPAAITAKVGSDDVKYTLTVTKDGKEVTSYTEPGTYKYVLDTAVADGYAYAGHEAGEFKVLGKSYADTTVYASVDGKNVEDNASFPYSGAELKPVVVVRDAKNNLLSEGTDYTVKFVDAEDKDVETASKVGTYKLVVKFADDTKQEISFKIVAATLAEIRPTADFFAIPADGAATPTFVGSTKSGDNFDKGVKFELAADQISVKYYASKVDGKNVVIDESSPVKASDLTKAETYFAKINVLTTVENFTASNLAVQFEIKDSVLFTDVDANAWYAKPVYEAANLKYMNGMSGTKLFMPEANITRAELSAVLFNMAGQQATGDKNASFPTKFDDVDKDAWFAETVAWASQAGVMNGYDADSFGPFDNASREQVACILYNYAKAQGKDVSVKDADAALAKYTDGASVSSWAKTAVAWAVENGVMGNGSKLNCFGTITRAEVAAMAVNFQPEAL